jgi:hypothetical protein
MERLFWAIVSLMSKTSLSYVVRRYGTYFTVDSLRLWFRNIVYFVTDNDSGIHCRRLGLAQLPCSWHQQTWDLRPPNPKLPHKLLLKFGVQVHEICFELLTIICAICAFVWRISHCSMGYLTLSFFSCCLNSVSLIWVKVFLSKVWYFQRFWDGGYYLPRRKPGGTPSTQGESPKGPGESRVKICKNPGSGNVQMLNNSRVRKFPIKY